MANSGEQEQPQNWTRRLFQVPLVAPVLGGVVAAGVVALLRKLAHLMDHIDIYAYTLLTIGAIALLSGLILLIQHRKTVNTWKFMSIAAVVITGSALTSATAADFFSSGPAPFTPGTRVSIRATTPCCTNDYIAHDDNDDNILIKPVSADSPPTLKADATWNVVPGLDNSACISLESANQRGKYLRQSGFQLHLAVSDGTPLFNYDATFCRRPAKSGQGYSFMFNHHSDRYIRHFASVVYIAEDGGSPYFWDNPYLWPNDTAWLAASPWS